MSTSTTMSFCFCSVREENLTSILVGDMTLDELRENRDNQYLDVRQASLEHYTEELVELLGEGHDSHNNRRRGFQYFLENTIKPNNEKIGTAHYVASRDLILSEDEGTVMFLPIPNEEINTNDLID